MQRFKLVNDSDHFETLMKANKSGFLRQSLKFKIRTNVPTLNFLLSVITIVHNLTCNNICKLI